MYWWKVGSNRFGGSQDGSHTPWRKPAMEMLLTGQPVSAERAMAMGLVNRVTPPDGLKGETEALAAIAQAGEGSVRDALSALDQAIRAGQLDLAQARAAKSN